MSATAIALLTRHVANTRIASCFDSAIASLYMAIEPKIA